MCPSCPINLTNETLKQEAVGQADDVKFNGSDINHHRCHEVESLNGYKEGEKKDHNPAPQLAQNR